MIPKNFKESSQFQTGNLYLNYLLFNYANNSSILPNMNHYENGRKLFLKSQRNKNIRNRESFVHVKQQKTPINWKQHRPRDFNGARY